ncbi:hypothetical protein AAVH_29674 [Aphelenchoides avenae]|nr:hypothetical protein AAVH_29674 [Aphelenchus avenae]
MATRANEAKDGNKKSAGTKFCNGQLLKVEFEYCTHCRSGSGEFTINGITYGFAMTEHEEDED